MSNRLLEGIAGSAKNLDELLDHLARCDFCFSHFPEEILLWKTGRYAGILSIFDAYEVTGSYRREKKEKISTPDTVQYLMT